VRKLLEQALYALEYAADMTKPDDMSGCKCPICTTIPMIKAELAKPEQEPAVWGVYIDGDNWYVVDDINDQQLVDDCTNHDAVVTPYYAAPVDCKWPTCRSDGYQKALSDYVADQIVDSTNCNRHPDAPHGPDGGQCKCQSWSPGEAS